MAIVEVNDISKDILIGIYFESVENKNCIY